MRYKSTNIRRVLMTSGEYQVAEMNEIGVWMEKRMECNKKY